MSSTCRYRARAPSSSCTRSTKIRRPTATASVHCFSRSTRPRDQARLDPFVLHDRQPVVCNPEQIAEGLAVDDPVALGPTLNLVVTGLFPIARVADHCGADHAEVDVDETTGEVLVGIDRRRVVAVLPERPAPVLTAVVRLASAARDELHASLDLARAAIPNQEMHVSGGDLVVQGAQAEPLARLVEPADP
jgi:hypothetical protein